MLRQLWKSVFVSSKRRKATRRVTKLRVETLERREVMAASLASSFLISVPGGSDSVRNVTTDSLDNTYIAGAVTAPADGVIVDFDPQSHDDNRDLVMLQDYNSFVAKYDPAGVLQWIYLGPQDANANVYLAPLSNDVFVGLTGWDANGPPTSIAKLDSGTGTQLWSSQVEASGLFVIDEQPMNPARIYAASSQCISVGGGFCAEYGKLNAYSVGPDGLTSLWSAGTTWTSGTSKGWGSGISDIAISPDHASIYASGHFRGNVDFNPSPTKTNKLSTGSTDAFQTKTAGFVWKLSSSGAYQWADAFTVGKTDSSSSVGAVELDPSGNIVVAGGFSGTVDLDPGKTTLTPTTLGRTDLFVAKLNPAGGLLFAKNYGTASPDVLQGMTLDAAGNIYINARITAPSGEPIPKLNSYVQKISNTGATLWVYAYGGMTTESTLVVKKSGSLLIIGTFTPRTTTTDPNYDLYLADTANPTYTLTGKTIFWAALVQ